MRVHNKTTTCITALKTVNGVLCKANAKYNVDTNEAQYIRVKHIRSRENIYFI